MKQKLFVAGKGLIVHDGKVLILQEGKGDSEHVHDGKWQFPGGRINFGEHPLDGLKREVYEESGLHMSNPRPIYVDHWMPKPIPDEDWQIVAVFYRADVEDMTEVKLSHEHKAYAWIGRDDIDKYILLPEDLAAFNMIQKDLT